MIPLPLLEMIGDYLYGKTTQVHGFVQGQNEGLLVTYEGQQYVINIRPREQDESFTLFELGTPEKQ